MNETAFFLRCTLPFIGNTSTMHSSIRFDLSSKSIELFKAIGFKKKFSHTLNDNEK